MVDFKTGGHSVYEMKYHFVWVTKYRYHILTGEIAHRVREIIRQCCLTRDITIIKGSVGKDHIHLLLSCPPSKIIQYLKQRKSIQIIATRIFTIKKEILGSTFMG